MSAQPATLVAAEDTWMQIAPGSRLLFVASTGGHLTQLAKIAARVGASAESTWVTFDTPQARSLLMAYRDVRFVPYVGPRDLRGVLRTIWAVAVIARRSRYDAVLSTGAGIALALPFVPRRLRRLYIESVSRVAGPSLTGKLLAWARVERRTQHPGWASRRWPYEFTLLDQYDALPRERESASEAPLSVLVTLGTIQPYRFDAAVEAVLRVLGPQDRVVWQVGCTTGFELPGQVSDVLRRVELQGIAAQCDVVVSHAGVGSVVDLLDIGVSPVLLARRASHGEHVDDHQAQIASVLVERDLATVRQPEELTRADLLEAANRVVVARASAHDVAVDAAPVAALRALSDELYALLDAERGVA